MRAFAKTSHGDPNATAENSSNPRGVKISYIVLYFKYF